MDRIIPNFAEAFPLVIALLLPVVFIAVDIAAAIGIFSIAQKLRFSQGRALLLGGISLIPGGIFIAVIVAASFSPKPSE